ncbi:phosphoribosylanthranilate isomerase [bacterium]|nr:phosphoribosylanthranilate isomerase [bacterium]
MVREEDMESACELGVDAVGFIFVPSSPRAVKYNDIQYLRGQICDHCKRIAVFQNPEMSEVKEIADELEFDFLQFHGEETPQEIEKLQHPYFKAFRIGVDFDTTEFIPFKNAHAWLLDSENNGTQVPAELVKRAMDLHPHGRVILAGGLTVENLHSRLTECHPYGVDVARGIEQQPRIKDFKKMKEFVRVCRDYK